MRDLPRDKRLLCRYMRRDTLYESLRRRYAYALALMPLSRLPAISPD